MKRDRDDTDFTYGGQGCVGYLANLVPEFCRRVGENFVGGKATVAARDWAVLIRLHLALTTHQDRTGGTD